MKAIAWEVAAATVLLSPVMIPLIGVTVRSHMRHRRHVRALERWLESLETDRRRRNR